MQNIFLDTEGRKKVVTIVSTVALYKTGYLN